MKTYNVDKKSRRPVKNNGRKKSRTLEIWPDRFGENKTGIEKRYMLKINNNKYVAK